MDLSHVIVCVEHRFTAPPEAVFALLTDVERMASLGPEHHSATWTDETRQRFTGANRMGDMTWQVPCVVIAHEPPTRFGWTVGEPGEQSSTWTYDLRPDGAGTVVTQRFEHGPGSSYLRQLCETRPDSADRYIAGRSEQLRDNMRQVLASADDLLP
jgi:uncharacterized protein YndB with AHSA1/START domain